MYICMYIYIYIYICCRYTYTRGVGLCTRCLCVYTQGMQPLRNMREREGERKKDSDMSLRTTDSLSLSCSYSLHEQREIKGSFVVTRPLYTHSRAHLGHPRAWLGVMLHRLKGIQELRNEMFAIITPVCQALVQAKKKSQLYLSH